MRPIRLSMEAFGPYLDRQDVDFEAFRHYGLFLIHGPTGSGKSTILDAIVYALFDDAKVERGGSDFVSTLDPGSVTRVTFEFEHRGARYRVTRSPAQTRAKLRGEGVTQVPADATLEDLTHGEVLATKARDVTRAIEALLHTSSEQFRQTVLLPQGEFRKVVTDHAARREVLSRVFRTERFQRLTERIKEKAKELEAVGARYQERRRELLAQAEVGDREALEQRVLDAVAARSAAEAVRAERDRERRGATAARDEGKRLQEGLDALAGLRRRHAELEAQLADVERQRRRLVAAERAERVHDKRVEHERTRSDLERARDRVEEGEEALGVAATALAAASARLGAEEGRQGDRDAAAAELGRLEALRPVLEELRAAAATLETASDKVDERRRTRARAAEELEQRTAEQGALRRERAELQRVRDGEADAVRLRDALAARTGAIESAVRQDEGIAALRSELAALDVDAHATERWLATLHGHAAGVLAAGLRAGEACPVCGSTQHPAVQPSTTDLDAVRAFLDGYRRASGEAAALRARIDEAEGRRRELAAAHGWAADETPDANDVRRALAEADEQLAGIAEAKRRIGAIDEALRELDAWIGDASAGLTRLDAELAEALTERATSEARLVTLAERVDPDLRQPGAFDARLERARERSRTLEGAREAAQRSAAEAGSVHEAVKARLQALREAAVSAAEQADRARREYLERLAMQAFADEAALLAAEMPADDRERLAAHVAAFDEERTSLAGTLEAKERELAGATPPDVDALEDAVLTAEAAWHQADDELTSARSRADQLANVSRALHEVEARYAQLEARLNAAKKLRDLAAGRVTGRARVDLETFVLQRIVAGVLQIANRHLARTTDGRYALHLVQSDDVASSRGLELDVSDNFSGGERRPVHTLSGGEGFLASLALALGLSESAQRSSGASELGALFIDEGFGSLDAGALDTVVEVLRSLPTGGRLVGVITHVDEMKRRIPAQLLVEKQAVGSRVVTRIDV